MQYMLAALKNQSYLFMNYPKDGAKLVNRAIRGSSIVNSSCVEYILVTPGVHLKCV